MQYFERQNDSLIFRLNGETVMVSPWGEDSLRTRAALFNELSDNSPALLSPAKSEPVIIASAASISFLFATNLRIFLPISASAFSASASENGEAAVDTYASSAWINASIPQAAATLAGAVVMSSASSIAYFGNIS